jgi:hypothetical protein
MLRLYDLCKEKIPQQKHCGLKDLQKRMFLSSVLSNQRSLLRELIIGNLEKL